MGYRFGNQLKRNQKLEEVIVDDIESEKAEEDSYYKDGAVKKYYGKRYERNPENRKKAIEIHGLSCVAFEFNFEKVYGERGKDFIEVHHVKPLSAIDEQVFIDPNIALCLFVRTVIGRFKEERTLIKKNRI
ncbi:HNH endonuclease [Priestia megaterium]|uniref:HNH endonuclease n=1 Tax=Priestia megaterium TaxID=1404 RepID=UPI00211D9FC2|nr:hypothetical protein [Priestia megaterium]